MQWLIRLITFLAAKSSRLNSELVAALERLGRPGEWDLTDSHVRNNLGVTCQELSGARALEFRYQNTNKIEAFAWPSLCVYEVPAAILDPVSGLTFVRDRVVTQSNLGFRDSRDSAFITGATQRVAQKAEKVPAPIASLGRSDNFYHFMLESMPRILAIRSIEPTTQFISSSTPEPFATSVASLLDLDFVVRNPADPPLYSTKLFVTTAPQLRRPSPAAISLLQGAFKFLTSPQQGERLYISRRASSRSFGFEADLEQVLADLGFSILLLEELDMQKQIERVSTAKLVVAPHGAGLTHMLFMDPRTRVLELATNTHWHESFRNLAWLLDIDFRSVFVDDLPTQDIFDWVLENIES